MLLFSTGVEAVSQREQVEVIGIRHPRRWILVVPHGPLESADQSAPHFEPQPGIGRQVEIFGIGERLEAFLEVVQADLVTAPERPIPFDGPSATRAGFVVGDFEILVEVRRTGFRPERHVLEDPAQVTTVEELIAGTGGERRAQFQVLKGVLLEVGRREPVQPLRQKKVKLDGSAAVSHDQIAVIISVDVPAQDGESQRLAAGRQFAEEAGVAQMAVACGLREARLQSTRVDDGGLVHADDGIQRNGHRCAHRRRLQGERAWFAGLRRADDRRAFLEAEGNGAIHHQLCHTRPHDFDDVFPAGRTERSFYVQFVGDHAEDLSIDDGAVLERN